MSKIQAAMRIIQGEKHIASLTSVVESHADDVVQGVSILWVADEMMLTHNHQVLPPPTKTVIAQYNASDLTTGGACGIGLSLIF